MYYNKKDKCELSNKKIKTYHKSKIDQSEINNKKKEENEKYITFPIS